MTQFGGKISGVLGRKEVRRDFVLEGDRRLRQIDLEEVVRSVVRKDLESTRSVEKEKRPLCFLQSVVQKVLVALRAYEGR